MEIDLSEWEIELVELKYCERCGGLWLRPVDDEEVYCPACLGKLADFPLPRKRRKIPGLPMAENWRGQERIEQLLGLCGPGGNA